MKKIVGFIKEELKDLKKEGAYQYMWGSLLPGMLYGVVSIFGPPVDLLLKLRLKRLAKKAKVRNEKKKGPVR
ncbi:MAG: hypothetical protein COT91_03120 [Candidatus Doudnabacteria bacterium CG10_big_fil_rev_8_21_14_0_10_41_10]|uniref:Uncharacterized protein n=1 Tax=Candidatus Doudnabacteria bacterium CG10_big_fil_rev_8_21_14_0_10_41_10 TaxID=1974551 RepID=A0A2H0VFD4_9BACT|nr:MAG: hypothetical protein COT91_03120 [Candidatus Doudnabacteria bacterium CG10_big_fil_rev_8_21_14_0_10_41_10]